MFYKAENYHQDFLTRNPKYPYIVVNDLPKVEDLKIEENQPLTFRAVFETLPFSTRVAHDEQPTRARSRGRTVARHRARRQALP